MCVGVWVCVGVRVPMRHPQPSTYTFLLWKIQDLPFENDFNKRWCSPHPLCEFISSVLML